MCIEPNSYQGSLDQPLYHDLAVYVKEINRIRSELTDLIFTANYFDDQGAEVNAVESKDAAKLIFKVHGNKKTGQRAIVIVNNGSDSVNYNWTFTYKEGVKKALLYSPFEEVKIVKQGEPITIKSDGLHILVEN